MVQRNLSPGRRERGDFRVDAAVAERAAGEWGVLSTDELRECGLTRSAIRRRVERGWLHRVHIGVYAVGHPSLSREGQFLAAVKACGPRAALSHFSSAELQGFRDPEERVPHVTVVAPGLRRHPGIRVHRTTLLTPKDVTRVKGIPATSAARTVLDLGAYLNEVGLRRLVRRAQGKRRVTVAQLVEALDRVGPRRGTARLRRILAAGPAPTKSELESVVLDLLLRAGFEPPEVNRPIILSRRRVVPDFRWPDQRLVVEADGAVWHDNRLAREEDAERQALLEAHGYRVLRVTWSQAVSEQVQTVARIRAAGAPSATKAT